MVPVCRSAAPKIRHGRLKDKWEVEYTAWQKWNLSGRRFVYIWADGVYLQARMESQAEYMLVIIGATPDGSEELLGFQAGFRESAQRSHEGGWRPGLS